jgi:acetyltransferase-like isoleucine patch superfamily enzyme
VSATSPLISPTARIHATADIDGGVVIGANTVVWHRAQIRSGARLGRDCVIGRDVYIDEGVVLGDRVKVQNAALIYHGVTIEDGVFVGPGAILTNDRRPRALNAAGELARAEDWTVSPIRVGVGASIGAGAIVVAGCDVGPHAMVGAGSVVTHDVPGHALVAGNPARLIGWVCVCGTRLEGAMAEPAHAEPDERTDAGLRCAACGRRYAYLRQRAMLRVEERPPIAPGREP